MYVGNISVEAKEENLFKILEQHYTSIKDIQFQRDNIKERQKYLYGFVYFKLHKEAVDFMKRF